MSGFFKSIGRNVSPFAFGTWAIGGESNFAGHVNGWGPADKEISVQALRHALDQGIDLFDTADVYGNGVSEELLGQAFAERHESSWAVVTKFGNRDLDGSAVKDFSAEWLGNCVDGSLRRLKRSYLDCVLMHSPADNFDWATFDRRPFEDLKKSGKILSYGVSARSANGALRVVEAGFGTVIQLNYNCLDRRMVTDVIDKITDPGAFDFFARVPLASGFLTGKYAAGHNFSDRDIRCKIPTNDVAWRVAAVERLGFLRNLPGGLTVSALRFCLAQPSLTATVVGVRSSEQLHAVSMALDLGPLAAGIINQIEETVPDVYPGWRN